MSTSAQAQVVVYRVNAGGRNTQAADITYPDWSADEQAAETPPPLGFARNGIPSIYVNEEVAGDQTAGRNQAQELSGITNPAAGEGVFVTQRWDPVEQDDNMVWSFPVSVERTYKVALYFSEMYGEGLETREFDIFINGVLQEDNFNILEQTGNDEKVGVEREYIVSATDDVLEIEFVNQVAPAGTLLPAVINAIEIVDMDAVNSPPTITDIPDQENLEGQEVSLQVVASDPTDDAITGSKSVIASYLAENLPPGLSINEGTGLISGNIDLDAADVYNVRIIVLDGGFPTAGAIENFTWTVSSSNPFVSSPIEDFIRFHGDPAEMIDLNTVFSDPFGDGLVFSLEGNNNQALIDESLVNGSILSLVYSASLVGTADITVRATNLFEEFVEEEFTVTLLEANPQALVQVTPAGNLGASTFNPGTMVVENTSSSSARINQVTINLSTALYPDMVFDPSGNAGDNGFKCLTPDSGAEDTGFIAPANSCVNPFSDPNEDGFYTITFGFDDFDPGEIFTFSVDADPTSIKGNPGVGNAGSVGGIEMIGATVTVDFSDESTAVNDLFHIAGTGGGSEALLRIDPDPAPAISIDGVTGSAATVTDAVQHIVISGTPGQQVRLFQSDGRLNVNGVPGGGFDLEPFESNEAIGGVWDYEGVIGAGGTVALEVLLRRSNHGDAFGFGGLNRFVAVFEGDFRSRVSNSVVLELQTPSTATLIEGWNMVGLSYDVADDNYDAVFGLLSPTQAPYLWDDGSYVQMDNLAAGVGYWLDVEDAGEVTITGADIPSVDVNVTAGWNMVSGPSCFFDIETADDPAGIIIPGNLYRFDGSYVASVSLTPNTGYWLEVTEDGTLTFDCNAEFETTSITTSNKPALAPHAQFGVMQISDDRGYKQNLYFGGELADKTTRKQYNMPPVTQRGFDARFVDNSRLVEGNTGVIKVRGATFPITLEMTAGPVGQSGVMFVQALSGETVVESYQVYEGDVVVISDEKVTALRLGADAMELQTLPETFALTGNYPNPFNPSTSIVFDLPEDAFMQVAVYDLLGRQVMLLDAVEMTAGAAKQVQLDASSLASGTYMYQVQAKMASGTVVSTGRMTLLK